MIAGYSFLRGFLQCFQIPSSLLSMLFPYPVLGSFLSCSSNNAPCPQHRKSHWQVVFIWPLVFKDRDILNYIRAEIGNTSSARSPGHQAGPLRNWGHSSHQGPLRLHSLWSRLFLSRTAASSQSADQALILWFACVTEGLPATPTL